MVPPSRLDPERTTSKSPWGFSQGPANHPEIRDTRGVVVTNTIRRPKAARQPVVIRRILLIRDTGFIIRPCVTAFRLSATEQAFRREQSVK